MCQSGQYAASKRMHAYQRARRSVGGPQGDEYAVAIPLMTGVALVAVRKHLDTPLVRGPLCRLPFVLLILVFVLGFLGLAYSFVLGIPRQDA
jgi:hypothetical protein